MHKETRSASEGCEEGGRRSGGGARAHEGGQSCSGRGWEQVGPCGHMTLPRHLDGDLPGTFVRLCSVRSEAMALGRRSIREV